MLYCRRPLKYFPGGHNNQGSIFACFTGVDFILASIGAEDMSKQTISFWSFDSKHPHKKTPIRNILNDDFFNGETDSNNCVVF